MMVAYEMHLIGLWLMSSFHHIEECPSVEQIRVLKGCGTIPIIPFVQHKSQVPTHEHYLETCYAKHCYCTSQSDRTSEQQLVIEIIVITHVWRKFYFLTASIRPINMSQNGTIVIITEHFKGLNFQVSITHCYWTVSTILSHCRWNTLTPQVLVFGSSEDIYWPTCTSTIWDMEWFIEQRHDSNIERLKI